MPKLSRRALLMGGTGLIGTGGAVMMTKPKDQSGPRNPYFLDMQAALASAGISGPTLVIDRSRLNANIDTLMGHLPDGMAYRIVAKSLPSLALLGHIRARTDTSRLMTFNQPMLTALSLAMPDADQLLGKPMPVGAAETYFATLPADHSAAADQVQWLIDTPARLDQYTALARKTGRTLRLNLELDVGLHRGGLVPGPDLKLVLETIDQTPELSLSGLMGYEPHLPALPTTLGWRDRAKAGAWALYREALDMTAALLGADKLAGLVRNAAGSPTYRYYQTTEIANEVSAGSCLVKPTHFDTDLLAPFQPASFIATPVIKALDRTRLPGLEFAEGTLRAWDPNSARTVFIYGGHWLADPVDPPGLSYNKTFGRSSNQEMLNGARSLDLSPDDTVFFRPHQSEAVFLQFGDIAVFDEGRIVDQWPVFPASA